MCGFEIRKIKLLATPLFDGGIANPTLPVVEPFLTVDFKSTGTIIGIIKCRVSTLATTFGNTCQGCWQHLPKPTATIWAIRFGLKNSSVNHH